MSFFDNLCYKCRKQRAKEGWKVLVGDHCHHEPREEPEPKCPVCSYGSFRITVDNQLKRPNWGVCLLVKFCPECARPLGDEK